MYSKSFLLVTSLVFVLATTTARIARSDFITFSGLTPGLLNSYQEGEYVVSWFGVGLGDQPLAVSRFGNIAIGDSNIGLTGGLALGAPIRIARVDGRPFDFLSIDVANIGTAPTGSVWPETFTGFEDPFVTTNPNFTTFLTPEARYKGLTSFGVATIGFGGDNYLIDNIQVQLSAVPESSSVTLLAVGIVGGILARRHRRSSK